MGCGVSPGASRGIGDENDPLKSNDASLPAVSVVPNVSMHPPIPPNGTGGQLSLKQADRPQPDGLSVIVRPSENGASLVITSDATTINLMPSAEAQERLEAQVLELAGKLGHLTSELDHLRMHVSRQPTQFTVGQYNILAGYLGNNTEPWFLYGVDMPAERRKEIFRLHGQRLPDGKPANAGWPNYVQGVLTKEEQKTVERVNLEQFAWERRKGRLMAEIKSMDADIISLVECDHYEDHFKPGLVALGYDSLWQKRPRPACQDGCCIAWRRSALELVKSSHVEYVDKYDPATKKSFKDRIALISLLRFRLTGESVCFVSTHLARNPETSEMDKLRARQIGQVLREVAEFTKAIGATDAPVILAGDLNATSFGKLRGIAAAVTLLEKDSFIHPFAFDCADVPTGATSVTTSRNVRIDAIMYQTQRLELSDIYKVPHLSVDDPIPNATHPSDHAAISAKFCFRSTLQIARHTAREWYLGLAGREHSMPLNTAQLQEAFTLYEHDGGGTISSSDLRWGIASLLGPGAANPTEVDEVLAKLPTDGIDFDSFVRCYTKAIIDAGMPGIDDIVDAFNAFDTDKNGTLEFKELLAVFSECSPAVVPEAGLNDLFKSIDKSGDGRIDVEEFAAHLALAWMSKFT